MSNPGFAAINKGDVARCRLCQVVVTNEDFCYGCESYICIECDTAGVDVTDGHTKIEAHTGDTEDAS